MSKRYEVRVDDNFHPLGTSGSVFHATFSSRQEAIMACERIVNGYLEAEVKEGMTAEELYGTYKFGGPDPFIVNKGGSDSTDIIFSAWNYAKQRCQELINSSNRKEGDE